MSLFNLGFVRRHGGQFILRIEDTDRERSTAEAVQVILDGMRWLNLDHDEGPFYQTRRMDRYAEVIAQFLCEGSAYHCYCSREELEAMRAAQVARKQKPRYDGRCRSRTTPVPDVAPVVRFRNPETGSVVVEDVVHGPIVFDSSELDDLIIARSDGTPPYNFCVVVDDYDMRISHVIRGDDHINNTPRQINMLRALGAEPPVYAHVPMILGPDGAKLSKRHGAVSVLQYRDEGFLPEGLLNYLARLGWSHGDQEIFTLDEMTRYFDIADVNKSASALNPEKLLWTNQQHILKASPERLARYLEPQLAALALPHAEPERVVAVARAQQERARTLREMAHSSEFFFRDEVVYDEKAVRKHLGPDALPLLAGVRARLAALAEWRAAAIHEAIAAHAAEHGVALGKIAQPLRVAVAGGPVSPPIDVTLEILGRDVTLQRVDAGIELAQGRTQAN
jgi:glutamyl-tRNA synthetase